MGCAYHGAPLLLMSFGGSLVGDENWELVGSTENKRGGEAPTEARDPPLYRQ